MSFIGENIQERQIVSILSHSFVDYSMSVIVSRALPDVRDGLKPVHRRILHAMNALNMTHDKPFKKSARIVGEVIGKYHPHGDSAVYETMVRMAQSWNMGETLIDGHGNFGSMDGDSAAAMRYTEARLSKLAGELLSDLRPEVVDYQSNFDETETEPSVLPARYPNLLVNGSEGIAVGMATKIPPHNLREVCEAVIALLKDPEITTDGLMNYIKGPDFPTRATIMGTSGIKDAYETGKGSILVRGLVDIIEKKNKTYLMIREVPFQVNPKKLESDIRKIQDDWEAYLKERTKKNAKAIPKGLDFLEKDGLKNLTDLSNEPATVTIEIELKKNVNPELVLNYLYKHTQLQTSFPVNNLALVPKKDAKGQIRLEPQVLTLKKTLAEYIKHQIEVVTRLLQYELKKKQDQIHKIDGVVKALDQLDKTIATIREAKIREDARLRLMALLSIDETQANAILEMQLQRLTNSDQQKERDRQKDLATEIASIQTKLANEELIKEDIQKDLQEIAEKYGSDRKTVILPPADAFNAEDLVSDDEVVVTITNNGFIKRTLESTYRTQRRKGIGVSGMSMYEDDFVHHLHVAKNKDTLLFFTNRGRVYEKKVYEIQEANANSRGKNIKLFLNLQGDEVVQAVLSIREFSDKQYLVFATSKGIVKKSKLSIYGNIRKNGIVAVTLDDEDQLVGVSLTGGDKNVTLITKDGLSITFDENEVKSVGRTGRGVKGIDLKKTDRVVSFVIHEETADLLTMTNTGFGKRTALSEFRIQSRNGKGVICHKLTEKSGELIGSSIVQESDTIMLITKNGTLMKLLVDEISQFNRNTQGTKIIHLRENDVLQAMSRIPDEEDADAELDIE